MRRLCLLFALAILAASAVSVSAQGVATGTPEFSPPVFVPGEVVTVIALIDPGTLPWTVATIPSGFTEGGEAGPQVLSVALENRKGSPLLVVRFVPWRAGPGYLPGMTIGGLEIPRIRFDCQSALTDGNFEAPEPMPQLDMPGLYTKLYVLAGLLLVAVLAGIAAVTKVSPWFRVFKARRAYARARREFDELLDRLAKASAGPAVWAELCAGLRTFAGIRTGTDLSAMTASEVQCLPAGTVPGDARGDLAGILAMGDEARFAGNRNLQPASGIRLARALADRIDAALLAAEAPGRTGS